MRTTCRKGKRGKCRVFQTLSPKRLAVRDDKGCSISLPATQERYAAMMRADGYKPADVDAGLIVHDRDETTDYVAGKSRLTFASKSGQRTRKAILRVASGFNVHVLPLVHHGAYYVECGKQWWSIRGTVANMQRFLRTCLMVIDVLQGFNSTPSNGRHDMAKPYAVRAKINADRRKRSNPAASFQSARSGNYVSHTARRSPIPY